MKRLDPRGPLVFDTRALSTGSARVEDRTVPAPAYLGVELVSIPEGADLQLHVQLEGVSEGTLVTATVRAPSVRASVSAPAANAIPDSGSVVVSVRMRAV